VPHSVKEKILVITHLVPRPDMNSGDLRLFTILERLSQEYDMTFFSTNSRTGDQPYLSLLRRHGIRVPTENFSFRRLLKTEKFRIALLEFYFTGERYLDKIRLLQPDCRVIIDSVDVHYLRFQRKYDLSQDEADRTLYRETKERELAIYRKADSVITVTRDDAAALTGESQEILCEVVPNIHKVVLGDKPPERNMLIFVGGFSHEPNVDAVLYFCNEILPLIRENKPYIRFMIVGSNPPEKIRLLESETIMVTGFVPETAPYLHRSYISVAPLRYGAGMKGKIGEAMAHGVPVVTTSVGAEGMGLCDRENAMIADSPHDFASAVLELLDDNILYETIRNNAVNIIMDNYTPEKVWQTMSTALERICEQPARRMRLRDKVAFYKGYITDRIKAAQVIR
jgi:glycosyltransferase involved in cell wall biosynthesis